MMLEGEMREVVEISVKQIATARKCIEITEGDVKLFDEELNELCEKWHNIFKDMDGTDFALFMLGDLMELHRKEKEDGDK